MQNKFSAQIIWEKWVDPFGENMDEAQWNNYDNEDEDTDGYPEMQSMKGSGKPIRVIASPMGLIPYNEYTSSAKIFNFWVGHTNFNLSTDIVNEFEKRMMAKKHIMSQLASKCDWILTADQAVNY